MPRITTAARCYAVVSLLAFMGAAQAATVDVSFVNPANFSDAGTHRFDEKDNLDKLARHIQDLGQRLLPADQRLKVEVLDVDLAGEVNPAALGTGIRRLRGQADAPRIKLRYTLEVPGQAARGGEETLTNLNYLRGLPAMRDSSSLYHEKRLLETWFRERLAGRA